MNKRKLKALILMMGAIFMAFLMINVTSQAARMDMVDVSNNNGYMSTTEYVSMRNEFGVKALTVMVKQLAYTSTAITLPIIKLRLKQLPKLTLLVRQPKRPDYQWAQYWQRT